MPARDFAQVEACGAYTQSVRKVGGQILLQSIAVLRGLHVCLCAVARLLECAMPARNGNLLSITSSGMRKFFGAHGKAEWLCTLQ